MSAVATEIIQLLTGTISEFATGFGAGLGDLAKGIFLEVGENGAYALSTFGALSVIFAGVALTIGLSRFVLTWVTSFGN